MRRIKTLCAAVLLACAAGQVSADASSHAANAGRFLQIANADKVAVPVYAQVQQMFAARFAEAEAAPNKQALLESYQAKANALLDKAVGWDQLKPDMVKLYTRNFSEQELEELIAFYQSPVGKKVMKTMPALTEQSAQLTQEKLETAVPAVNQLLAAMSAELQPKKKP